ncbi:hypothetical protein O181_064093 [Austropuccinia psidii MF-1]|uniref:Uncharacterized protein n=1 Tax=Austropuccinia psidii MF-1 TaxID=1389203 RepID=A0A9Q3I189_9BASI|nr:hypothetical protein [Austropuccinia psidii MF-1]
MLKGSLLDFGLASEVRNVEILLHRPIQRKAGIYSSRMITTIKGNARDLQVRQENDAHNPPQRENITSHCQAESMKVFNLGLRSRICSVQLEKCVLPLVLVTASRVFRPVQHYLETCILPALKRIHFVRPIPPGLRAALPVRSNLSSYLKPLKAHCAPTNADRISAKLTFAGGLLLFVAKDYVPSWPQSRVAGYLFTGFGSKFQEVSLTQTELKLPFSVVFSNSLGRRGLASACVCFSDQLAARWASHINLTPKQIVRILGIGVRLDEQYKCSIYCAFKVGKDAHLKI